MEAIAISKCLKDRPYAVLVAGRLVIRETVYGVVKRLAFFVQWIEACRDKLGLNPDQMNILDVGCGTGVNVTIPLADAGYSLLGLDLDPASIGRAKQLASNLKNIEFRCGSIENEHFGKRFHVAICSEVLEHLQEPEVLLQKLTAVIHEGGLVLVTVPNGFGFFELDSFFWRRISRHPQLIENLYRWENRFWKIFGSAATLRRRQEEYEPERLALTWSTLAPDTVHYQSFTRSRIAALLKSQGLEPVDIRNNTFLAGNLVGLLVRESNQFLVWNADVADKLPSFLASGWLIAAQRPVGQGSC